MNRATIYYENDLGGRWDFTGNPKTGIDSWDGYSGNTVTETVSQGYKQHGNTLEYLQLDPRDVTINFYLDCASHYEYLQYRREFFDVFSPLVEGYLHYQDEVFDVRLRCHLGDTPFIENYDGQSTGTGDLTLVANNPIWYDNNVIPVQIASWTKGFQLPFQCKFQLRQRGSMQVTINNDGQVPVPCTFEFGGLATDPIIYNNTTGRFIKLDGTINSDQRVYITTDYRHKSVTLYDDHAVATRGEYLVNDDSEFFWLEKGRNAITFTSQDFSDLNMVTMTYRRGFYNI